MNTSSLSPIVEDRNGGLWYLVGGGYTVSPPGSVTSTSVTVTPERLASLFGPVTHVAGTDGASRDWVIAAAAREWYTATHVGVAAPPTDRAAREAAERLLTALYWVCASDDGLRQRGEATT